MLSEITPKFSSNATKKKKKKKNHENCLLRPQIRRGLKNSMYIVVGPNWPIPSFKGSYKWPTRESVSFLFYDSVQISELDLGFSILVSHSNKAISTLK